MGPIIVNNLELRLAEGRSDLEAAQRLRYQVFYEDMGARPSEETRKLERDFDHFDDICDHLLVLDRENSTIAQPRVIGTYRFLRRSVAREHGGFYSADEYDLSPLENISSEIMELGRSCVDANFRSKAVMQILWKGIAEYVFEHNVALMFGCASFPGIDPKENAMPLSYLAQNHAAPAEWCPRALPERYVDMNLLDPEQVDMKQALREMPPLIKGYLRLGGIVGDGAVIDEQFNTHDICLMVETDNVTGRYLNHYAKNRAPVNPDASLTG